MRRAIAQLSLVLTAAWSTVAWPASFNAIRIGDNDGFGVNPTAGLCKADGVSSCSGPADTDGDGLLEVGEYLPDLNLDSQINALDDFDNRSAEGITGQGFSDISSSGSLFTDSGLEHQAGISFIFDFSVAENDINAGSALRLRIAHADQEYAIPVQLTLQDATVTSPGNLSITTLGLIEYQDFLLNFSDVFGALNAGAYHGALRVDLLTSEVEPFVAFDFVELAAVPIPAAMWLFGGALGTLGWLRRRQAST